MLKVSSHVQQPSLMSCCHINHILSLLIIYEAKAILVLIMSTSTNWEDKMKRIQVSRSVYARL